MGNGAGHLMGMGFLLGDENVLKLDFGNGCTPCECMFLKNIELYTNLNGWTVWYVNYISIKLFLKSQGRNQNGILKPFSQLTPKEEQTNK